MQQRELDEAARRLLKAKLEVARKRRSKTTDLAYSAQAQQPTGQQLTAAAAAALAAAATVDAAVTVLAPLFLRAGIGKPALRAALAVVMSRPPDREGFWGPAQAQTARLNLIRRAQFLVSCARRLVPEFARLASGEITREQLALSLLKEARYYGQHTEALWNRMRAAAQADTAATDYGALLGWHTVRDSRTSAECRAADRHNFRVDRMPSIGFPGAVHPHCRCMPGPPFPGAPLVGENVPGQALRLVPA
jgi:hypothetical protein